MRRDNGAGLVREPGVGGARPRTGAGCGGRPSGWLDGGAQP
jgi:hypothetical protein